ncbi:hypothetical protein PHYC_03099 [Phycisphaerales bacterium]|nr:hypothetical protein PHYC_03099 [Phycisphaerales bacterium]
MSRTHLTVSLSALLTLAGAASAQFLPHQWDLMDGRTLDVKFAANGGLASPDMVAVNRALVPMHPEPDPTGGANFTFGDSVLRAMAAWNDANGAMGWNLNFIGAAAPANPVITVKLAQFNLAMPVPHRGAGSEAIALFIPGATNPANGKLINAEIWFNVKPGIDWGIGHNQMPLPTGGDDDDFKFDPITVALHEFGHAMRLDHPAAGGTMTRMNSMACDVMVPLFDAGVHQANPRMGYNRYPSAGDIAGATASLPAPGPIALSIAGLLALARRRR